MATYLVTQATGMQSQWVIKHLLLAGVKVHAIVRNLEKVPPTLQDPRITLFQGESKNVEEVLRAAQGCKGVFLNTFPIPGLEAQQAQAVIEACLKAGVESIVASTVTLANDKAVLDDPVTVAADLRDYFASKAVLEDLVRRANFKSYTILRPAIIDQDYMVPHSHYNFPELPTHGELVHCLNKGVGLPQTDAHDVGKYAAAALLDPAKFSGQEIDLVSEILTIEEARDIIAKVSGKDVRVRKRTPAEQEETLKTVFGQRFHLVANARDFYSLAGVSKEVAAKFGIPPTSLEECLQREKDHLVASLP
ncbi:NmrA family protein [Coniochaeta ligniaria NRRL 30616]|uniref:NmrA family protein n=1 Tax=Coniochaeta ligniaria NRRL 30616 TaxID=1408157 RepID=A0A1J7J9G1_9PEZI|nr:NmrA family protein [Coniochaeta ligniaria NRRL 30616]